MLPEAETKRKNYNDRWLTYILIALIVFKETHNLKIELL